MAFPTWNISTPIEIISIGDSEMLTQAFQGLAAITSSDGFGNMVRVAFLIGILGLGAKSFISASLQDAPKFIAAIIIVFMMFGPKTIVIITDGFDGTTHSVGNVPVGVAAPFGVVSITGRYFATTFESAFGVASRSI